MKKRGLGSIGHKRLLLLMSAFLALAAGLAYVMLPSSSVLVSPFLRAQITGGYGAGWGSSPSTYTFGGNRSNNPTLTNVPASVSAGKMITLKGTNFTPNNNRVHIGKKQVNNIKSFENGTSIIFEIPPKKDLAPGNYPVFVRNSKGTSNTMYMNIADANASVLTGNGPSPITDRKPTVNIKANNSDGPITIPYNTSATISWTYTNKTTSDAKPCWLWHEASNGLGGERRATGSESTGKLTASRTFNLRCGHEELTPSDSVTVNVADSITPMAGNQKPIAYANWSINGVNQGSKLFVKKGVPVNGLSLTGNSSSDPDGWTTVGKGVSQGGKCELNADMELGDTPSFERAIQDPAHSGACGAYFGSRTFNNAPGEYMIRIMRITDAGGLKSNDALVWVNVAAP